MARPSTARADGFSHLERWANAQGGDALGSWVVGDFDKSGTADLAYVWNNNGWISIDVHASCVGGVGPQPCNPLPGATGAFDLENWANQAAPWPSSAFQALAGDFNLDGYTDVAIAYAVPDSGHFDIYIDVYESQYWNGIRTFGGPYTRATAEGWYVTPSTFLVGDFTGSGFKKDIAFVFQDGANANIDMHAGPSSICDYPGYAPCPSFGIQRWETDNEIWANAPSAWLSPGNLDFTANESPVADDIVQVYAPNGAWTPNRFLAELNIFQSFYSNGWNATNNGWFVTPSEWTTATMAGAASVAFAFPDNGSNISIDTYTSTGSQFSTWRFATQQGGWINPQQNPPTSMQFLGGDFNGDGQGDVADFFDPGDGNIYLDVHLNDVGFSFDVSPDGWTPPDPNISASPNVVGVMIGSTAYFFDHSGTPTRPPFSLGCGGRCGDDASIAYDPSSGLWFISAFYNTNRNYDSVAFFVSTDSSAGTFNSSPYVPIVLNSGTLDQPHFTVTQDKIVVSAATPGSTQTVWEIDKPGMLAGNPVANFVWATGSGSYLREVQYGGSVPYEAYMVQYLANTILSWVKVTGTQAGGDLHLTPYTLGISPQLNNAPNIVEPNGTVVQNFGNVGSSAMWQNNRLWWSNTDGCGSSTCVRMVELATDTNTMVQNFDFSQPNAYLWGATPGIDSNGDMWAIMSAMPSGGYPGLAVAGLLANGASRGPGPAVSGLSAYTADCRNSGQACWGDFFGAAQDPGDGTVWLVGEYAANNGNFGVKVVHVQASN